MDLDRSVLLGKKLYQESQFDSCIALLSAKTPKEAFAAAARNKTLGLAFFKKGNTDRAVRCFEQLNFKKNNDAHLLLARTYAENKNATVAVEHLGKYLAQKSKLSPKHVQNDTSLLKISTTAAWKKLWQTTWYKPYEATYDEAEYHHRFGRDSEALLILNEIIAKKRYAPAFSLLGKIEWKAGNKKNAINAFGRAAQINKKSHERMATLAEYLFEHGKYKKAERYIQQAINFDPYEIRYYGIRSKIRSKQESWESAEQDALFYQKFAAETENNLFELGQVFYFLENYPEGMRYFSKCLNIKKRAKYYKARGMCYFRARSLKYAHRDLVMALDIAPTDADVNFFLGEVFYMQNKKQFACPSWKRAMQLGKHEALLRFNEHCNK